MKPASGTKLRVLVVDDETSVLFTYKMILQQQGYDVTAVGTCREALEKVEQETYDLLLCDYSLEQQHTGFEVIQAGRKKNPKVPAVILTGYASTETAQQAKDNGINVLFKPIEISEFLSATSALLKPGTAQ